MQALPMEKCGPVFSLLLPEKSAVLSVQLSRLRLTQTLQYLLKKRMKKKTVYQYFPRVPVLSVLLVQFVWLLGKNCVPARHRVT